LRTGKLKIPQDVDRDDVDEELKFYGIEIPHLLSDDSINETFQQIKNQIQENLLRPYSKEIEELKIFISHSFHKCLENQDNILRTPLLLPSEEEIWKNWEQVEEYQKPPIAPLTYDLSSRDTCKAQLQSIIENGTSVTFYKLLQNLMPQVIQQIQTECKLSIQLQREFINVYLAQDPSWMAPTQCKFYLEKQSNLILIGKWQMCEAFWIKWTYQLDF